MWWFKWLSPVIASAMMTACGFHLRGEAKLPFDTIAVPATSPLLLELQRNLVAASSAKIVPKPEAAEAIFDLLGEAREKVILSLNTQGRVREYQLRYRVAFRVRNAKGGIYIPVSEIALRREITFNDQVLAKETEEQILFRDMQTDMVQQIIRRMQASKLRSGEDEGDAPRRDTQMFP